MKNIINFIVMASHEESLRIEFRKYLEEKDPSLTELMNWFKKKEYVVTDDECMRILENKSRMLEDIKAKDY